LGRDLLPFFFSPPCHSGLFSSSFFFPLLETLSREHSDPVFPTCVLLRFSLVFAGCCLFLFSHFPDVTKGLATSRSIFTKHSLSIPLPLFFPLLTYRDPDRVHVSHDIMPHFRFSEDHDPCPFRSIFGVSFFFPPWCLRVWARFFFGEMPPAPFKNRQVSFSIYSLANPSSFSP